MDQTHLLHSLADAFNAVADEAQNLAVIKTVLEHKLRFAHEQVQYLADKYALPTPEVAESLAKLQLPPHTSLDNTSPVPLLQRRSTPRPWHQTAVIIRDGRRITNKIDSVGASSKTTLSSRESLSHTSPDETSMSTALEQDFTVEGRKGNLQCPFSKGKLAGGTNDGESKHGLDNPPYSPADPICAAMLEEASSQPATNGAGSSKCPIRFMDKHSPEEIAHYVETHKHAIPRSHEVCLRRYQKNETQMKKLDSKYGNIVSMIEGLSHLHQPMLPESEEADLQASGVEGHSNQRVENWAQDVSGTVDLEPDEAAPLPDGQQDRQSHFDRPLKEVRVGESPSRPWGISVPVLERTDRENDYPSSPPPAPVRMADGDDGARPTAAGAQIRKCPFDHTKLQAAFTAPSPQTPRTDVKTAQSRQEGAEDTPFTQTKGPPTLSAAPLASQPTFINPGTTKSDGGGPPQMIFTGPVFIGYPMEQAIQYMNFSRGSQ